MKKINNFYLIPITILIITIYVSDFIPKINRFEDELIALTSHIFFITDFEFKAPYLVDDLIFTPTLTTGFNTSIGGAIGWIVFKDFYFSRLFNFIWLILEISLFNIYLYKNKFINIKFIYFSILGLFCIPLWYNSLYGLGEILSSILFFNSLLIYEKNPKLSMFMMSVSIFFGKFIIFLSFIVFVAINLRKQNLKSFLYFLLPPFIWYFVIFLKTGFNGLLDYVNKFLSFLFFHGLLKSSSSSNFFEASIDNISKSEIAEWSYATIIRVGIVPIIFSLYLLIKYLLKKNSKIDLSVSIIIITNYLYFYLISYQKYLRYSQIFLVITIYYLLFLLSNEESIPNIEKVIYILLLSMFLSNEILILFLILNSILSYRKKSKYISLIIFLCLNIINLHYESRYELKNNLEINECKKNISSIECIKNYLPYEY